MRWFHRLGLKLAWGIVGNNAPVILVFAATLVGLGWGSWYVRTSVSIANLFSPEAELVANTAGCRRDWAD